MPCPTFSMPTSLSSLESAPYELLPYPATFDPDSDDRTTAFNTLLSQIASPIAPTAGSESVYGLEEGDAKTFLQNTYTLVRKCLSLSPSQQSLLAATLGKALTKRCDEIVKSEGLVCEEVRSAFGMQLYFAYQLGASTASNNRMQNLNVKELNTLYSTGNQASLLSSLLYCTKTMHTHANKLWACGVLDETWVNLPILLATTLVESPTTLKIQPSIKPTLTSLLRVSYSQTTATTLASALVDLLCTHLHIVQFLPQLLAQCNRDLISDIFRDVTATVKSFGNNYSSKSTQTTAKHISEFVSLYAKTSPGLFVDFIVSIEFWLNEDSGTLRQGYVTVVGYVMEFMATGKITGEEETATNEDSEGEAEEEEPEEVEEEEEDADASASTDATPAIPTRTVEEILVTLLPRVHDISSFVRSSMLKVLSHLACTSTIPVQLFMGVTDVVIDRLKDKTVVVRRNAMSTLKNLLENNPYGSNLEPDSYKAKSVELKAWMEEHEKKSDQLAKKCASMQVDIENRNENGDIVTEEERDEAEALVVRVAEAEQYEHDFPETIEAAAERAGKIKAYQFTTSAVAFIDSLEGANTALASMLLSKSTSDVNEALRFYVQARHFRLPCAVSGMRSALHLMFSDETSIRNEVLKTFIDVFINSPSDGDVKATQLESKQITHNLIVLVGESTLSEQACIEEAIAELVKTEQIPNEVFLILWSVASKATGPARSAAMTVLGMAASADPSIVDSTSRLRHLHQAGFGDYVERTRDWRTVRAACAALKKIGRVQDSADEQEAEAKVIVVGDIIESLATVARGDWLTDEVDDTKRWCCAAEQAVDAIFKISSAPDKVVKDVVSCMHHTTFESVMEEDIDSPLPLARFFFVLGHVAMNLLLYTEDITRVLKRANASKAVAKQEVADTAKRAKSGKLEEGGSSDDEIEKELGVAQEAEALTEQMMDDIAEQEIVGRGLLGVFGPLLLRVVANENNAFGDVFLQQTATLALCKFMCISNAFCTKNLPLLLTAMQKNQDFDTTLRANTVISLGDIAFRFPNTFEPYTPRLYCCLRDDSDRVKRHGMMVLTHLILNDMIKVKGNVCEVAMLIVSDDSTLSDMSRLLFNELSKRSNNPVYNLIPDVVSQLSVDDKVKRQEFKTIMQFLLQFITKEKQSDMLVDKLIKRFETASSIGVKRDLAFCIAQLKVTEKSIKIMNDTFKFYKSALFDDDVFGAFMAVLKKGKSFASPAMKELLDELDKKITEENSSGMANYSAANKAQKAKEKAAKRVRKNDDKRKRRAMKKEESSEEEDEFGEDDFIEFNPNAKKDKENVEKEDNVEGDASGGVFGDLGKEKKKGGAYGRSSGRRGKV